MLPRLTRRGSRKSEGRPRYQSRCLDAVRVIGGPHDQHVVDFSNMRELGADFSQPVLEVFLGLLELPNVLGGWKGKIEYDR